MSHNVRHAHGSVHIIHGNADRIQESVKCLDNIKLQQSEPGTVCLCSKSTMVLTESTIPVTIGVSLLHFCYIKDKYCVELYVHCTVPLVVLYTVQYH